MKNNRKNDQRKTRCTARKKTAWIYKKQVYPRKKNGPHQKL